MSEQVKRWAMWRAIEELGPDDWVVRDTCYDALAQRCRELEADLAEQADLLKETSEQRDFLDKRQSDECFRREKAEAERDTLAHRCRELGAELETERMRLVACGVVAMANTPESAAKAREMHPEYTSASCQDVMRAVDAEMALRAENVRLAEWYSEAGVREDTLRAEVEEARRTADYWKNEHLAGNRVIDQLRAEVADLKARLLGKAEESLVESVAEAIYVQWSTQTEYVPWVDRGNSLKQGEARRIARSAIKNGTAIAQEADHE